MGHQKKAKKPTKKQAKQKANHSVPQHSPPPPPPESGVLSQLMGAAMQAVSLVTAQPALEKAPGLFPVKQMVFVQCYPGGGADSVGGCLAREARKWGYKHVDDVEKWNETPYQQPGITTTGCFIANPETGEPFGFILFQGSKGMHMSGTELNEVQVLALVVNPDHRRRGIAKNLLWSAEAWGRRNQLEKIIGEMDPDVQPFYRKQGWVDADFGSIGGHPLAGIVPAKYLPKWMKKSLA